MALEDFDPPNQYDLVVIINVLEHCRDLTAIFTAVRAMIAAGGILVFADVGFDGSELREVGHRQWDAAHPLRPLTATIDEFLSDFEPLFDLRRPYTAGLYKRCMFRNFVGRAS